MNPYYTCLLKQLNFNQRVEKWIVPLQLLPYRHCHGSNDDDRPKKSQLQDSDKQRRENAKLRMNKLLQSFSEKSYSVNQKINIYRATSKLQKEAKKPEKEEFETVDFSLRDAAKNVAESMGGDKVGIERDLLGALRSHSSPKQSLNAILSDMIVAKPDSGTDPEDSSFEEGMPRSRLYEFRQKYRAEEHFDRRRDQDPIHLFSAPPLNIFSSDLKSDEREELALATWDVALEREKKLCVNNQPRNHFEEMIRWTDEGKVWTFPINNEIGLEEEKAVSFSDHIFLEKHLEGWCPSKGPIRHFMELVCVGLSKNPHITAERKRAHIEWYKNYLESKADVLKDVGAL